MAKRATKKRAEQRLERWGRRVRITARSSASDGWGLRSE